MKTLQTGVVERYQELAATWGSKTYDYMRSPGLKAAPQAKELGANAAHFARVADLLARTGCQNLDELEAKHDALRLGLEEALDMIPPCEHAHCADDKERFRKLIGG